VLLSFVFGFVLGVHNINVNTLAPGLIKTDFSKALWENEDTYNKIVKSIPQGKIGSPDDISGMALYLASEASDFVTGSIFTVDGGITT
jgi:NAD(P)-dependent dehydrogenase (short-subunit alcohol dehydrogenase family)